MPTYCRSTGASLFVLRVVTSPSVIDARTITGSGGPAPSSHHLPDGPCRVGPRTLTRVGTAQRSTAIARRSLTCALFAVAILLGAYVTLIFAASAVTSALDGYVPG